MVLGDQRDGFASPVAGAVLELLARHGVLCLFMHFGICYYPDIQMSVQNVSQTLNANSTEWSAFKSKLNECTLLFKSMGLVRFLKMFLEEASYTHQDCVYLIKNTVIL